jgi:restriction system protein
MAEMWEINLSHEGLNKSCLIKGSDKYVVEQKVIAQRRTWDAEESTIKLKSVLQQSLQADNVIDWDMLLNHEQFPEKEPVKTNIANKPLKTEFSVNKPLKTEFSAIKPLKPQLFSAPEPIKADLKYQPRITLSDKLLFLKKIKLKDANKLFMFDHEEWVNIQQQVSQKNRWLESAYAEELKKWEINKTEHEHREDKNIANWEINKTEHEYREDKNIIHWDIYKSNHEQREDGAYKDWEIRKNEYEEIRLRKNQAILNIKNQYVSDNSKAIIDYCEFILEKSNYPDYFPQEHSIDYQSNSKILIVDYALPDIDSLPKIKSVKYIASTNEFVETIIAASAITKLYDELLYQIVLRTLHELYEADAINALDSIVFNGWVNSIDKSTGHHVNACIMSVNASKDEFMAINLKNVDPKACFKQLKGVGSAKLHGLSPIAPIMTINKQDKRFVSAYDVVEGVDESENLAAMDWQDFENLIREIFEKEFSSSGGEVKITQASRDGGVDAIAFDPDPIRGGKIVIQAKRYTNVVGVSAVRDLYGTTLNEGATKGILVTTANFGPDAYDFAKGKPLTLLNGSNLLHLLEKHGHKAKIDLKAAKIILADQKS